MKPLSGVRPGSLRCARHDRANVPDAADEQEEEQGQPGNAEVDRVLQIGVVDLFPGRPAYLVEGQRILPRASPDDRMPQGEAGGGDGVAPTGLGGASRIRLEVNDGGGAAWLA